MPGPVNVVADDASHHWDLLDTNLLTHFNNRYPQAHSWQMRTLSPATSASLLIGALASRWHSHAASPQRLASATSAWALWQAFCTSLGVNTFNLGPDPIPLLQLFAHRYHSGSLAPGRHPVHSRTVEDVIGVLGQTYASMGAVDPRLNRHGALDLWLTSLLQAWKHNDALPPFPCQTAALS